MWNVNVVPVDEYAKFYTCAERINGVQRIIGVKTQISSVTDLKSSDLADPNSLAYPASETVQMTRNDLSPEWN